MAKWRTRSWREMSRRALAPGFRQFAANRTLVPQIAIELSWSLKLPTDGMAIPRMKNEKPCFIRGIAMPSVGFIGLKTQILGEP